MNKSELVDAIAAGASFKTAVAQNQDGRPASSPLRPDWLTWSFQEGRAQQSP